MAPTRGTDGPDGPDSTGVGAILAAGAGSRYEGATPKVLARLPDGSTLLDRALAAARAAGLDAVAVVLGSVSPDDVGPLPPEVTVLLNPGWAEGQSTSLGVAVAWARERGAAALTVGLGDQPGLRASAWAAVAASRATPVAVATYAGVRGHPVRLTAEVWPLLPETGDVGARPLLATRSDLVTEVPCVGDPGDVDTVADLVRWTADAHPSAPPPP